MEMIDIMSYQYSNKYQDPENEYRSVEVNLPYAPKDRILCEEDWRAMGIIQSLGWEHVDTIKTRDSLHYIFKRPIGINPTTGKFDKILHDDTIDTLKKEEPWLFTSKKLNSE